MSRPNVVSESCTLLPDSAFPVPGFGELIIRRCTEVLTKYCVRINHDMHCMLRLHASKTFLKSVEMRKLVSRLAVYTYILQHNLAKRGMIEALGSGIRDPRRELHPCGDKGAWPR